MTSLSCLLSTLAVRIAELCDNAHTSGYVLTPCLCCSCRELCSAMKVLLPLVQRVSFLSSSPASVFYCAYSILLRVTKARLDLLVLPDPRVPRVHEAPQETQEKMDPVAPLANQ